MASPDSMKREEKKFRLLKQIRFIATSAQTDQINMHKGIDWMHTSQGGHYGISYAQKQTVHNTPSATSTHATYRNTNRYKSQYTHKNARREQKIHIKSANK